MEVSPSLVLWRILRLWRKACPATDEGLVFPVLEGKTPRMGAERDLVGLPDVLRGAGCHAPAHPWHALRHTFASHYMMAGGNILELQKLLGHATLATTMVYAHLSPDHLAAGVARMSFAVIAGVADFDEERRRRAIDG